MHKLFDHSVCVYIYIYISQGTVILMSPDFYIMFAIVSWMIHNNSVALDRYLRFRGFRGLRMLICSIMFLRIDAVLSVTIVPTFRSLLSQFAASVHFCQSSRRHYAEDSCFRKMLLLNLRRFCVQDRKLITPDCLLSNTVVESFQIRMSHAKWNAVSVRIIPLLHFYTHVGRF